MSGTEASLHKFQEPSRSIPLVDAKRLRESFGRAARGLITLPGVEPHKFRRGERANGLRPLGYAEIEPLPLLARNIASEVEAVLKRKGMAA